MNLFPETVYVSTKYIKRNKYLVTSSLRQTQIYRKTIAIDYINIYIYMIGRLIYVYMCVCVCVCVIGRLIKSLQWSLHKIYITLKHLLMSNVHLLLCNIAGMYIFGNQSPRATMTTQIMDISSMSCPTRHRVLWK